MREASVLGRLVCLSRWKDPWVSGKTPIRCKKGSFQIPRDLSRYQGVFQDTKGSFQITRGLSRYQGVFPSSY